MHKTSEMTDDINAKVFKVLRAIWCWCWHQVKMAFVANIS